ncbi:MAG: sigma-70 family RNA polymerase sigma factor [Chitinophagaceae bacterium]|nr:sigma-70 family RNA polymerase sigma factor [Chitinophagaceae bacterium]
MFNRAEYNELTALQRLSQGDDSAFDELFYANWDHVYSAALYMTKSPEMADDIAQETFLLLWKERQNISRIKNLKGFLYTHVKFQVHKVFRRMKVEDAFALYLNHKLSLSNEVPEQETSLALKDIESSLQKGIEQLSPQQKRAFTLSREHGLTHEDISKLMGVSKKTVKDYIVRSLAFLRPYIDHYGLLIILIASF